MDLLSPTAITSPSRTSLAGASPSASQRSCVSLSQSAPEVYIPLTIWFNIPLSHWLETWLPRRKNIKLALKSFLVTLWSPQNSEQVGDLSKNREKSSKKWNKLWQDTMNTFCVMWKFPNATFKWYLDKRPFQQQKVACFLCFLSTLSHLQRKL